MYFNDVHIAYYVAAIILGLIVGEMVNWANKRLPEYKKVFSKDFINCLEGGLFYPRIWTAASPSPLMENPVFSKNSAMRE